MLIFAKKNKIYLPLAKNIFTGFSFNMRINFTPYNFSFKSDSIPKLPKEGVVLGYDDSISAQKREAIRDHLETQTSLTYQKYYEVPKSDYEMQKMLKSWGIKTDNITKKIIVPPYLNFIALGNDNFRGALPRDFADYKKLKESGITTVISATPGGCIKNTVEKNGMNYIKLVANCPVHSGGEDYIFTDLAFNDEDYYMSKKARAYESYGKYEKEYSSKEFIYKMLEKERTLFRTNSRKFIDALIKSVRAWQNGCCFIGCEFGSKMTSNAISVIDAFNPKGDGIASDYLSADEKDCVIKLYKKLTEQDKKLMGWTKVFESSFLKRFVRV